jgi:hypothetical protein
MHGSVMLRWASAERSGALGDLRLAGQPVRGVPLHCLTGDSSCSSCWDEPGRQSGPHSVRPCGAVICLTAVPLRRITKTSWFALSGIHVKRPAARRATPPDPSRSLGDGGARLRSCDVGLRLPRVSVPEDASCGCRPRRRRAVQPPVLVVEELPRRPYADRRRRWDPGTWFRAMSRFSTTTLQ